MHIDTAPLLARDWERDQCWDLAAAALASIGVTLPDAEAVLAMEGAYGRELHAGERPRCGDVVVMRGGGFGGGGTPHVGVVCDAGGWRVVHTSSRGGAIVTAMAALTRARNVVRVVRPVGLDVNSER